MTRFELLRYDTGLSRKELAEKADVGLTTIYRCEQGWVPSARIASKIAQALSDALGREVRPSELVAPEDVAA